MALIDNLVLYSNFEDASSTTVVENTGTYTITKASSGNPVEAAGLIADCQDFTADYISTNFSPSVTIGTGDFTLAFWFNCGTSASRRSVVHLGGNTTFADVILVQFYETGAGSTVAIGSRTGAAGYAEIVSGSGLFDSNWHLCVFDRSGSTANMYIDNGSAISSTDAEWANPLNTLFKIGASYNTNANPYTGLLDEMGLWTRILTSGERTELYNSGAGITYPFTSATNTTNFFIMM